MCFVAYLCVTKLTQEMENVIVEKELMSHPVSFTESAVREIQRLLIAENVAHDHALRVGVKGGGCAGMTYVLGFEAKQSGDEELMIDGVKVFINKSHELY